MCRYFGGICGRNYVVLWMLLAHCLIGNVSATRISMDDVGIRSEYVDPNNRTIWHLLNLTPEQVDRIRAGSNTSSKGEASQAHGNQLRNHIRVQRLNEIRTRIESALSNNSDDSKDIPADDPLHEMAGYPICEAVSASTWNQSNNVTLLFDSSIFEQGNSNIHLKSALLRLYKMNPRATPIVTQKDDTAPTVTTIATTGISDQSITECAEPLLESQIRVTVSIIHQLKKKQRKKRICNTMMLSSTKTGWVEIDVKCATQYWKQQQQQNQPSAQQPPIIVGLLMIEVHDDEENQLKPGLYFQPPKCEQADTAVPWSFYRSKTIMPSVEEKEVPRYPRLDTCFTGYGSFTPKKFDMDTQRVENIKRQFYNFPRNRDRNNNIELTTSNSSPPTVDNLLENNENMNEDRVQQQIHQHRKRHHHSSFTTTDEESSEPKDDERNDSSGSSSSNSGTNEDNSKLGHHRVRLTHNHYHSQHHQHHQHQHHQHQHHNHHQIVHQQE